MPELFVPEAPRTVRLGSVGVLLLSLVDLIVRLSWVTVASASEVGMWSGFVRPGIRFLVGMMFAWGIAHMLGLFYWFWLVTSVLVGPVVVVASVYRMLTPAEGVGAVTIGPAAVVVGFLWLLTTILLLWPASLRAYWRHGRLWVKSAVG